MLTIRQEQWDGLAEPTLPPGFTYDAGFETANELTITPANSLLYNNPGSEGVAFCDEMDTFGGIQVVSAYFHFATSGPV